MYSSMQDFTLISTKYGDLCGCIKHVCAVTFACVLLQGMKSFHRYRTWLLLVVRVYDKNVGRN